MCLRSVLFTLILSRGKVVLLFWFNIFDDLGEIVVGSAKRAKNMNVIIEFARAAVAFLEFARAVVAFLKAFFLKKLK